jgi:class 3 adenylate cyclase
VEWLAEHHAGSGEILATGTVVDRLEKSRLTHCTPRPDAALDTGHAVFTVVPDRRMPELAAANTAYPHPYPGEFFALLVALKDADRAQQAREDIYARYLRERAVVFLSIDRNSAGRDLATLLDDLVTNALMDAVIRYTAGAETHIAGIGGGLAILTFDTPQEALDFALTVRARFVQNAIPVKTGIDVGPVLLLPNSHGRSGIAGEPVNVASKISEDAGEGGRINLTTRAAAALSSLPPGANPFEARVSGLTLTGVFV